MQFDSIRCKFHRSWHQLAHCISFSYENSLSLIVILSLGCCCSNKLAGATEASKANGQYVCRLLSQCSSSSANHTSLCMPKLAKLTNCSLCHNMLRLLIGSCSMAGLFCPIKMLLTGCTTLAVHVIFYNHLVVALFFLEH